MLFKNILDIYLIFHPLDLILPILIGTHLYDSIHTNILFKINSGYLIPAQDKYSD